ncbi:MAG: isocitrate lyase/phosphoenolpyruvate mutase family protein, partial [Burkholderiaceae bacterium]
MPEPDAFPSPPATTIADRRRTFRKLHEAGCFVIPNPWDIGSARALEQMGFKALATTSSGMAWSRARADGAVDREQVL